MCCSRISTRSRPRPGGRRSLRDPTEPVSSRNHVHWTSDYVRAFRAAGLEIERCEEPRVDRAFLATVSDDLRNVFEAAWLGMPVAIVWLLRRP